MASKPHEKTAATLLHAVGKHVIEIGDFILTIQDIDTLADLPHGEGIPDQDVDLAPVPKVRSKPKDSSDSLAGARETTSECCGVKVSPTRKTLVKQMAHASNRFEDQTNKITKGINVFATALAEFEWDGNSIQMPELPEARKQIQDALVVVCQCVQNPTPGVAAHANVHANEQEAQFQPIPKPTACDVASSLRKLPEHDDLAMAATECRSHLVEVREHMVKWRKGIFTCQQSLVELTDLLRREADAAQPLTWDAISSLPGFNLEQKELPDVAEPSAAKSVSDILSSLPGWKLEPKADIPQQDAEGESQASDQLAAMQLHVGTSMTGDCNQERIHQSTSGLDTEISMHATESPSTGVEDMNAAFLDVEGAMRDAKSTGKGLCSKGNGLNLSKTQFTGGCENESKLDATPSPVHVQPQKAKPSSCSSFC